MRRICVFYSRSMLDAYQHWLVLTNRNCKRIHMEWNVRLRKHQLPVSTTKKRFQLEKSNSDLSLFLLAKQFKFLIRSGFAISICIHFWLQKNQSIALNHYPFIYVSLPWFCQNLPHFHFLHRFIRMCQVYDFICISLGVCSVSSIWLWLMNILLAVRFQL